VEINNCEAAAFLSAAPPRASLADIAVAAEGQVVELDARSFWQKVPDAAREFWGAPLAFRDDDPQAVKYLCKLGAGKLLVIILLASALAIITIKHFSGKPKRARNRARKEKEAVPIRKLEKKEHKVKEDMQERLNAKKPTAGKYCYKWIRGVECKFKGCKLSHNGTDDDRKKMRALLNRYPCKFLEKCRVEGCAYQHPKKETSSDEDEAPTPDDAEREVTLQQARGKVRRMRRHERDDDSDKEGGVLSGIFGGAKAMSYREAWEKKTGCIHAADCKAGITSNSSVPCNRHCGGHHCTHFAECKPVSGGKPPIEEKAKEGVFSIGRLDPNVPKRYSFLYWEGGSLVTHWSYAQNQLLSPGHLFAPPGTRDWRKWETETTPFTVEGKYTFSNFDGSKWYTDVPLVWHVYPYADLAWASTTPKGIGQIFNYPGATIGQVTKPVFAYMVSANPNSKPDKIEESFGFTKNMPLDPAGRHDAPTVKSTCGSGLYGESGKLLAMHIEQCAQHNNAVLLWGWRAFLGQPWKDGKPTHEKIVA
jgi:hypothetical protein